MPTLNHEPLLFFLIAGEASGDLLGARLMAALTKATDGNARYVGIGGERMKAQGLQLLFDQSELAHMGLVEVVRHLPSLLGRIRQTIASVKQRRPDALITIDSPDFCFRVARALKGQGIPLIHYVAPSVWAWRPGRAKKIAGFLDHLMALLPFEPPYFTTQGLACTFVGHSLVESGAGKGQAERFRQTYGVPPQAPLLAVLPGSRLGEVRRLMPLFRQTVERLVQTQPSLWTVIPVVPHVRAYVQDATAHWPSKVVLTQSDDDKYDAFAAAQAALACSGTVSVELAMARLPSVIAYKVAPLTAAIARRFLRTRYATLLNIMKNAEIMPEFLQERCTPENLAQAVRVLMNDPAARQGQMKELAGVAEWLGRGQFVPSERAADTVLSVLAQRKNNAHRRNNACL